jgi:hypothetical protein
MRDGTVELWLIRAECAADAALSFVKIATRLDGAGKLLGVKVLDHIILTKDGALSMADRGFL